MSQVTPPAPVPHSRRGLSGPALAAAVVGIVLVVCLAAGLIVMVVQAGEPEPAAGIVSCEVHDSGILPRASVQWELTNHTSRRGSWTVTITVHDAEGRQVGEVRDGAFNVPSAGTVTDTVSVYLDAPGGRTCRISVN